MEINKAAAVSYFAVSHFVISRDTPSRKRPDANQAMHARLFCLSDFVTVENKGAKI
jgi:hypothetical protein